MRCLIVAISTTLLLLASCGESDAEKNAAAAREAANQLLENNKELKGQLANTQAERDAAQRLAERRKAVADTITTFGVRIVLHATLAAGGTLRFPSRGLFGGLRLERSEGGALSLGESGGQSAVNSGTPDQYQIAFEYEPDTSQLIVGQPITNLASVQTATAPYERLLSHTGLSLANGGTADVTIRVNGVEVISAAAIPVTVQSDGTVTIPLSGYFGNLFDRYTEAVGRR